MPNYTPRPDLAARYAHIAARAQIASTRHALAFSVTSTMSPQCLKEWSAMLVWWDLADAASAISDEYLVALDFPRPRGAVPFGPVRGP